ncbi:Type I restriction modification system N6-adenine DNA methyltransferase (M) subunit HsdM [Mycoplasmopsis bovigenitalium]|uniref:type I restriction-modification system subunit M n=1 Tax=Mycoplasmopsis bovigenitalium TaxID=2112 RepID=UPI00090A645A|nr:type I restriction-modification system subunit M [Mycoplasmopsis bovigenitalium]BAW18121.1 Type I restriction modification system N6-adenine DNA methyltransferase (M) subunit HsdM [Mycoplasmopsis bovigenitalium]
MGNKIISKNELGAIIWDSASKLRGNLDANEYKNYILGLIFYRFLSKKQEDELLKQGVDRSDLKYFSAKINWEEIDFDQTETLNDHQHMQTIKDRINTDCGYFIYYENLYQTWTSQESKDKNKFSVSVLSEAINEFIRSITNGCRELFEGIFFVFENELSKLGINSDEQTEKLLKLMENIQKIPTENQNYDVLGYVYEYLIGKFASSAGKKGGEFYTPHEVSTLMAEIVSYHLKDRETIKVYDPTSGSGSLLLTIGETFKKYSKSSSPVVYYAQELNKQTFNLTRMNLVMKGINTANIHVRNADTLEQDWPFFDNNGYYIYQSVDAVVSNPPYSQKWNNVNKESDERYKSYGVAPSSKADYAFLLHDLYHLDPDGILTIVLPHGVLFRGGSEKEIRTQLIKKGQIDTIIGLPANIFYGTGISTIIMVIKKQKPTSDIQFIDASQLYVKDGKDNKLEAKHIRKIVDTVNNRREIKNFSRIVSLEEIEQNDYNLNISRYIDNFSKDETHDLYSSMYGGVSENELAKYSEFLNNFPTVKESLFSDAKPGYYSILSNENGEIRNSIVENEQIKAYLEKFKQIAKDFYNYLLNTCGNLDNLKNIKHNLENKLIDYIFNNIEELAFIEKYDIYQILMNNIEKIKDDLELISYYENNELSIDEFLKDSEILDVKRKKDNSIVEWNSQLFSNEFICQKYFASENSQIKDLKDELTDIESRISEIEDSIDESEKNEPIFIEGKIDTKELQKYAKSIKETPEADSFESQILEINDLINQKTKARKTLSNLEQTLVIESYEKYTSLNKDEVFALLIDKWSEPIMKQISKQGTEIIDDYIAKFENLENKYKYTLSDINSQIHDNEQKLVELLKDLNGEESDMQAINELISILGGK